MKPGKWITISNIDPDREYLALLSYLPVKKFRTIPTVVKYSAIIDKQLRETEGLIGFSFHAELFKKRFWTLSVWEDTKYLNDFVSKFPHSETMIKLAPHMDQTKFTEWKIKSSEVPPDWDEAKRR